MDKKQMEAITNCLTTALTDFLKDKDFHTEILDLTLTKAKAKASAQHLLRGEEAHALSCGFNEQDQWVCIKPPHTP